jgi:hypothetical protein
MATRRPYKLGANGLERALESTAEVETSTSKIEQSRRTAAGRMKRDVIAVKRTWSFEWDELPGQTSDTWDGGLGRDELVALYEDGGTLSLLVPTEIEEPGGETYEQVDVLFGATIEEIVRKRNPRFSYELTMELVEV